jgi:hypothetical protein
MEDFLLLVQKKIDSGHPPIQKDGLKSLGSNLLGYTGSLAQTPAHGKLLQLLASPQRVVSEGALLLVIFFLKLKISRLFWD